MTLIQSFMSNTETGQAKNQTPEILSKSKDRESDSNNEIRQYARGIFQNFLDGKVSEDKGFSGLLDSV